MSKPFQTHQEYRDAMEAIAERVGDDAQFSEILLMLERIVRFEEQHGIAHAERLIGRVSGPGAPRARRTALISDIHGNHGGLLAVLADIAACDCDRILVLGDLVEGGDGDEEVVREIRRRFIRSVRGNHDENNDLRLSHETRAWLGRLPEHIVEDDVHFTHISPRARKRKINHPVEAWNVFEDAPFRLLFVGHAHVPLLFAQRSETYGEARMLPIEYNRPFAFDDGERYIACPGSVGYGRDDVGKLRYAIYDRGAQTLEFRALDGPLLSMDHSVRKRSSAPLRRSPSD